MEKIELIRKFKFNKNGKEIILNDPDPSMPPAKVGVFYSGMYPELLNSGVTGPKYDNDGNAVYTLSSAIGTKG